MFATAVRTAGAQSRNYATLREIEMRLKSIKNIEKITKTMKIVASTRLGKAERAKTTARSYVTADSELYKFAETKPLETETKKNLIIAVSSDKGLCGSIHSSVAKAVRLRVNELGSADIVAVGDKVKAQLMRTHASNIVFAINGVGKETPTFTEASLIANEILAHNYNGYSSVEIFYNDPVSSLSFESIGKPVFGAEALDASENISKYEIDTDNKVSQDVVEFTLANRIYAAQADGYAAEVSARRNAMDNASKNAGDMINKNSILYNRTRQAVITNELVDIITGASSLD